MRPDHDAARARYRTHARGYDATTGRTQPFRFEAIDALELEPGNTVLDAGSGTGMSFAPLQDGVGPSGRIIGVELSPDMMDLARQKVADASWQNVTLIEGTIEKAEITHQLDALLCFYTHDVMRSPRALSKLFACCKPGARVAVAGMKYFPWWLAPLNVYALLKAYPYMTTFEGLRRPYSRLQAYVPDLKIRSTQFGMGYIAHGRYERVG